jgi:hypothetical protein
MSMVPMSKNFTKKLTWADICNIAPQDLESTGSFELSAITDVSAKPAGEAEHCA